MKFWLGVLFTLLVVSPSTVNVTKYETFVREMEVQPERERTPLLDSMIDVAEAERQGECLWYYLQQEGIEITLRNVLAMGEYADIMGGACHLIGENDE